MRAAATADAIVKMFMIQTSATLSGCRDTPKIASSSRTANAALSQAMNRRIFALRRRFHRAVSPLCASFSKKSTGGLETATGRAGFI